MNNVLKNLGKLFVVLLPIFAALVCGKLLAPYLPAFTDWVGTLGVWGPLAFIATYVIAVVFMMPAFLLIIAGGAIFGATRGFIFSMTGALVGAFCAFLIARYLVRDFVTRKIATNPKLLALDRVIGADGRKLVFLLRLSPVIPFVVSNYALGVTRVRLADFMIGTIGLAPLVFSYAAFGKAAGATDAAGHSTMQLPVIIIGIAATLVLGWLVARMVRKAIAEAELQSEMRAAATPT